MVTGRGDSPLSPITRYQYERFWARFRAYQAAHADEPLEDQVRNFLGGLSAASRITARSALQRQLGDTVPWRAIRLRRPRRNEARLQATILSAADRARLFQSLSTPRDRALAQTLRILHRPEAARALLHVLWILRRAEAARLRWEEVDLDAGVVYVDRGKGGKSAWTMLPANAADALRAWHRRVGKPVQGWVFPGVHGRPVSPRRFGRWVECLLKRVGLWRPGRGCHAFRRSFATMYLRENGGDLLGLKQLMRHENIATTALYVYLQPEDLAPRLARLRL